MKVILTHSGLKKALTGKSNKSDSMNDEQRQELDENALSSIQLSLFNPYSKPKPWRLHLVKGLESVKQFIYVH